MQKELGKELEKLSSIRNKFAHRLSLMTLEETFLIDKSHRPYKIDEDNFKKFKERAIKALLGLRHILLKQKGIDPKSIRTSESVWIPVDKIKLQYDEK